MGNTFSVRRKHDNQTPPRKEAVGHDEEEQDKTQLNILEVGTVKKFEKRANGYCSGIIIGAEVRILQRLCNAPTTCDNLARDMHFLPDNLGFQCEYFPVILDTLRLTQLSEVPLHLVYKGVSDALQFCHQQLVLHCDVAPANIGLRCTLPLRRSEDVVLFDFDIASVGEMIDGQLTCLKCIARREFGAYRLHSRSVEVYQPVDEMEALVYTCLKLKLGSLPWTDLDEMEWLQMAEMKRGLLTQTASEADPELDFLQEQIAESLRHQTELL